MACHTRASIKQQHYHGCRTLLAFLECSKCYERVGHATAGSRVLASGLPGRIANMIFNMYGADGYIKAHGAVSAPRSGNRGLLAGCALAKDILKAVLSAPLGFSVLQGHRGTTSTTSPCRSLRTSRDCVHIEWKRCYAI